MELVEQRNYDCEWVAQIWGNYDVSIKYKIMPNGGVNIIDAHEISSDLLKQAFIIALTNELGFSFGKRTNESLFIEWKAHNILYKKGWFKKRTRDTGLDPKESWIRRLFYRCVCFIFSE